MGRGGGGSGGSHGVAEAISITEAVEVVDAPARIITQCTELLTTDQ